MKPNDEESVMCRRRSSKNGRSLTGTWMFKRREELKEREEQRVELIERGEVNHGAQS